MVTLPSLSGLPRHWTSVNIIINIITRVAAHLGPPGPLVEAGQPGAQVGGVAGVCGHLGQTTGDLSQSLGPSV